MIDAGAELASGASGNRGSQSRRRGQEPQVPSKATQPGRIPALDGLRAMAVGLVLFGHFFVRFDQAGSVGVSVFFGLSGFLITGLLVDEIAKTGQLNLRLFYRHRAVRLFPALALMLVFVCVVFRPPWLDIAGVVFYFANWLRAFGDGLGVLGPTWSLSVEEQFYFVWPLLVLAVRGRACLVALLAFLGIAASFFIRIALAGEVVRIYDGTDTRMDALLFGALGALLVRQHWFARRVPSTGVRVCGLVGASFVAACSIGIVVINSAVAYSALAFSCSALVLGVCQSGVVSRVLSMRPFVWVGTISYGIYLWHYPWIGLFVTDVGPKGRALIVTVLTVGSASASYYLVERPIRQRWRNPRRPTSTTVAGGGGVSDSQ